MGVSPHSNRVILSFKPPKTAQNSQKKLMNLPSEECRHGASLRVKLAMILQNRSASNLCRKKQQRNHSNPIN